MHSFAVLDGMFTSSAPVDNLKTSQRDTLLAWLSS